MKKNILVGMMCPVMAATAMVSPVLAFEGAGPHTGSDGASSTTQVAYEVTESEWTFSIPAAQTFSPGNLAKTGDVKVSPKTVGEVINLANGTTITLSVNSAEEFSLVADANRNSKIAYVVSLTDGGDCVAQDATVLTYIAGTNENTGMTVPLYIYTTEENIKDATVTGNHDDQLTFTVHVA